MLLRSPAATGGRLPRLGSLTPESLWAVLVGLVLLLRCAFLFAAPERAGGLPLRFAQDDFFYYLEAARNLVTVHRSTMDGHTLTNGYHPLYFLLLVVVSIFVHSLAGIFRFLWALDLLSAALSYWLLLRLFRRVCRPVLACALAALLVSLIVPEICDQMETTLAFPLGYAFLLTLYVPPGQLTRRRLAGAGLLASLLFLARLDAVLFVVLFLLALLLVRPYREQLDRRHLIAFCVTALPLPLLYLACNVALFHTVLPVSGMAKQLRNGHAPSLLLPRSFSGVNEALVVALLAALVLAWALRERLGSRDKVLLWTTLLTPLVFYALEMVLSDWPLWDWYFYPLRFAAVGIALVPALLAREVSLPQPYALLGRLAGNPVLATLLAFAVLLQLGLMHYKVDPVMADIAGASEQLAGFARTHPGLYAMGDRAGMFSVLADSPVLQAEGLMMDRSYLAHLRRQDDLSAVLHSYGANYYIAFVFDRNAWQLHNGCLQAMEPSIAGPSALRMRSTFCQAPVFQLHRGDGTYLVYRLG